MGAAPLPPPRIAAAAAGSRALSEGGTPRRRNLQSLAAGAFMTIVGYISARCQPPPRATAQPPLSQIAAFPCVRHARSACEGAGWAKPVASVAAPTQELASGPAPAPQSAASPRVAAGCVLNHLCCRSCDAARRCWGSFCNADWSQSTQFCDSCKRLQTSRIETGT